MCSNGRRKAVAGNNGDSSYAILAVFSGNILDSDKKGFPDSRESDCELGIEAHKSLADGKTKILINAKPYPVRLFFTGKTPKRN